MAVIISDTFAGTNGDNCDGRTPNTTNTPGNTWSLVAGTSCTIQSNRAVGAPSGGLCFLNYDTEVVYADHNCQYDYDFSFNSVSGGSNLGQGFNVGYVDTTRRIECRAINFNSGFQQQALLILRYNPSTGGGVEILEQFNFVFDDAATYHAAILVERGALTDTIEVSYTVTGVGSLNHVEDNSRPDGPYDGSVISLTWPSTGSMWVDNFTAEQDVAAALLTAPMQYQIYPFDSPDGLSILRSTGLISGAGYPQAQFGRAYFQQVGDAGDTTFVHRNAPIYQGDYILRDGDNTGVTTTVEDVGVGFVFTAWGDSNPEGRGNNRSVTPGAVVPYLHQKDYIFGPFTDPTHVDAPIDADRFDTIAQSGAAQGSLWPLVVSTLLDRECPILMIPACKGGYGINAIEFPENENYYIQTGTPGLRGAICSRIREVGGNHLNVLWIAEISDLAGDTQQQTFDKVDAWVTRAYEFGIGKTLLVGSPTMTTASAPQQALTEAALTAVAATNAYCIGFVSLKSISGMSDGTHLTTNAELQAAADLVAPPIGDYLDELLAGSTPVSSGIATLTGPGGLAY